jgi:hypothetical protein
MASEWYPEAVRVSPNGTPGTYRFMKSVFPKDARFAYAEFGFYKADTARNVCELFPNCELHLFDFFENIEPAREKLRNFGNNICFYGNTQRYNDSYNWNLLKLLQKNDGSPLFDYCFLDGAHTFAIDALNFFLCDRLLKVGGYLDFDDYSWKLRGSSLDPARVPAIAEQYTDEQIDSKQVALIVDFLVRPDRRYEELVTNKIFRKIAL